MKIYTKKGDKGKTSLLRGARVTKADLRIEAYGTVDELNAFIGHLCDQHKNRKKILFEIQKNLFKIGSILSSDREGSQINLPEITNDNIEMLENEIDKMEEKLFPLKEFILPSNCKGIEISFFPIFNLFISSSPSQINESETLPSS